MRDVLVRHPAAAMDVGDAARCAARRARAAGRTGTSARVTPSSWRSYKYPYAPVAGERADAGGDERLEHRAASHAPSTGIVTDARMTSSTMTLSTSCSGAAWSTTRPKASRELLATERVTAYIGFDPTASSLHVGSLLTVMGLARLQRFGHSPIAIVGGGTGMIGDPSGKSQERVLLSPEQIDENVAGIRRQLERVSRFRVARRHHRRPHRQQRRLAGDASICSSSCATPENTSPSTTCCRRNR